MSAAEEKLMLCGTVHGWPDAEEARKLVWCVQTERVHSAYGERGALCLAQAEFAHMADAA